MSVRLPLGSVAVLDLSVRARSSKAAVENLAGASGETEIHHCSGMQRSKAGWLSLLRWSEGEKCADTSRQLGIIYVERKTVCQKEK